MTSRAVCSDASVAICSDDRIIIPSHNSVCSTPARNILICLGNYSRSNEHSRLGTPHAVHKPSAVPTTLEGLADSLHTICFM